ncbi:hypothetical protein GCM10009759_30760 [Kitasatospora saccharophila]|uniref:Htaa protein n=1 Tax=Kitasatospora saccharophila TaxID=407973 RepID=A0ABN2WW20_9ACTN
MNATSTGRAGPAGAGVLPALLLAARGSGGSGSSSAADHGSHDDGTSSSTVLGSDSTDSGDDSASSDDGVSTFDPASATGTPLQGRYTVDGALSTFSGTRTTQLAAGSGALTIEGSTDLEERTLQFSWASSTGMAARVDGQNFAQATSSLWNATGRTGF